MIDLIIEGAAIYDGASPAPHTTDVAVVGDRIALVGNLGERDAVERVPASGSILCPGFIDVHSHSDELWLADGRCEGKIRQGVTTEIAGNCGTSVAPLRGVAAMRKAEEARASGVELAWSDLDEFYALVTASGVALNVATLVGLGTTRRCVRGDLAGPLDASERREQERLVRTAVEQGALGVSSGLIYVPSRYAGIDELAGCARAAAEAGMPRYVSHVRDEASASFAAVEEALEIGRRADVAVQCSHHKAARKKNWGTVHRTLELIARERERGADVGADAYPYVATWTGLDTILPEDACAGGRDATLARLRDPLTAAALALRLELDWGDAWDDIAISDVASERNAELAGMRLTQIAALRRLPPPRAALALLAEEELRVGAIFFTLSEDDVATVLSAPFVSIGSDASARAVDGPTAHGVPHPRTFGCFPRVFGRFVRGRRTLEFAEAIRRMTSLPAAQFGIRERGRIAPGYYADLVLFNRERIVDTATYERPYAYPLGIEGVWVNGTRVVRGESATGARPGRVLRGGRSSP